MIYSDVISAGLIRAKKEKYTIRDVHAVMGASLFNPYKGKTLTLEESIFIVKCSAVFHETEYTQSLNEAVNKERSAFNWSN